MENNISTIVETLSDTAGMRAGLQEQHAELINIPQPHYSQTGFGNLVDFLTSSAPKFNWAIQGSIQQIKAELKNNLTQTALAGGAYLATEVNGFLSTTAGLMEDVAKINNGTISFGMRNFFCPGDTILHVDNMANGYVIRFLWPMGREKGMQYTSRQNIDYDQYAAFIDRELHLIRKMDSLSFKEGKSIEEIWPHRPKQVENMKSGYHYYMKNKELIYEVPTHWSSVHLIETPQFPGTFHCNTYANKEKPGLQLILTSAQ